MIRQRGRPDARFGQPLGQVFGGKLAVAVERVGMEIDADGGIHVVIVSLSKAPRRYHSEGRTVNEKEENS
jgi:hypothetical protein